MKRSMIRNYKKSHHRSRGGDEEGDQEEEDDSKDNDVNPMDTMVDNDLCACTSARDKEGKCMAERWKDIEGHFLSIFVRTARIMLMKQRLNACHTARRDVS